MTIKLSPIHPGKVLLDEFIKPMNLSQNRLVIDIGVDGRRIKEIVLGKCAITADTTLRYRDSLETLLNFGWGCKRSTILTLPKINLANGLIGRSDLWQ
jgi:addiction module HigA family antidote